MTHLELLDLSLAELAELLARQETTSIEATRACLGRIDQLNERVGAFLHIDEAGALAQAQASDERRSQGGAIGPLDGVPLALKDNFLTTGLPTTAASRILEGYVPAYDATCTRLLREQGSVLLGKLNLDEFAMGSSTENSAFRPCHNPWNLAHAPGGSSGGSAAAVAAGMCFGALGTDTGGSIRQPASFCGVAGLKPTYGRVSRFGIVAFASSLDQVGPLARDVKSTAILLQAIAGFDPRDATSVQKEVPDYLNALNGDLKGLKVGRPKEYLDIDGLDDEVRKIIESCAAHLVECGAQIVDVSLPHTPYAVATYYIVATAEASSNLARYDGIRYGPRRGESEGLLSLYQRTRGDLLGDEVKRRIMLGTYVLSAGYYDAYYLRAQKVRQKLAEDFHHAFEKVDVLLAPTSPTPPFRLGDRTEDPLAMYLSDIFTISCNLAGLPGISVHAGLTTNHLPVGAQLMAPTFGEPTLLKVAHHLEQALGRRDRPPL